MSLLKIRDMSTLTTPPSNRQSVQTFIEEFDDAKVAEAIRREMARGGQVFYLHNRVESLDDTCSKVMELVPEVMVESAHGQMKPEDLEDIMHRFVHGGFQVLVSTTIIENGIDIPNVNTIIIDRSDMFGISQLYQLRGRVGRSDRTAYALLMYPKGRSLSELAMKRLQIISDMEVRGAGNLLGGEQSGDIYSVGFELYLHLLEEAVRKLSDEGWKPEEDAYLELEYSGFLPDAYIPVPMVKMEVYKKIAGIQNQDELDMVYAELEDRFGPVPEEVMSLLSLAEIRIQCKKLSIASLRERHGLVQVEFSRVASVSVDKLLRLMRESPDRVKLDPHRPNVLILKSGNIGLKEKSEFIREKLSALSAN
jgi:transcription-repair coupling factor (superfamily II helicase)